MKSFTCRTLVSFLTIVTAISTISGYAAAQTTKAEAGTPVGVWDLQITFRNCDTGDILRTRPGLLSIMPGGIMQEFGTGTAPLDRTDAQGVWRHTTIRYYTSISKAFRFAADGSLAGSVKLFREFELSDGGEAINVNVLSEVYDANGVLIATGCATEAGVRLQ